MSRKYATLLPGAHIIPADMSTSYPQAADLAFRKGGIVMYEDPNSPDGWRTVKGNRTVDDQLRLWQAERRAAAEQAARAAADAAP